MTPICMCGGEDRVAVLSSHLQGANSIGCHANDCVQLEKGSANSSPWLHAGRSKVKHSLGLGLLPPCHIVSEARCTSHVKPTSVSIFLLSPFQMKTGPFAEHSNQLWNISAVPTWSKVNQGLIRMYKAEVSKGIGASGSTPFLKGIGSRP